MGTRKASSHGPLNWYPSRFPSVWTHGDPLKIFDPDQTMIRAGEITPFVPDTPMEPANKIKRCSSDPSSEFVTDDGDFTEDPFKTSRAKSTGSISQSSLVCSEKLGDPIDLLKWTWPIASGKPDKPKGKSLFHDPTGKKWLGGGFKVPTEVDNVSQALAKANPYNIWAILVVNRVLTDLMAANAITIDTAVLIQRFMWRLLVYTKLGDLLRNKKTWRGRERHLRVIICAVHSIVYEITDPDSLKADMAYYRRIYDRTLSSFDYNSAVVEITQQCDGVFVPMDTANQTILNLYTHMCGLANVQENAEAITALSTVEVNRWTTPFFGMNSAINDDLIARWTLYVKHYVREIDSPGPPGRIARSCHMYCEDTPLLTKDMDKVSKKDAHILRLVEQVIKKEESECILMSSMASSVKLMMPIDYWLERSVRRMPTGIFRMALAECIHGAMPISKKARLHLQAISDKIKSGAIKQAKKKQAMKLKETTLFKPKATARFKAIMRKMAERDAATAMLLKGKRKSHSAENLKGF